MEELKGYLEGRINSMMNKAIVFEKKVETDRTLIGDLQKELVNKKSNNPEIGFEGVKEDLANFQKTGFYNHLLEQNMGILYSAIKELHTLITTLNLDVKIESENQAMYDQIGTSPSELFALGQGGSVEIADKTIRETLEKDLENRGLNEDSLKAIYETIPVA